jgi:membrane-associated phospholipid phosphatase
LWRRRRELGWAGVCALAFGILAALTTLTTVSAWDTQIVLAVNAVVATQAALRGVATAVTAVGSPVSVDVLTAVAVGVAWRYGDSRAERVRAAVYLVGARLVELGLETYVKSLVARPRPAVPHPLATATDASFPSGHTAGTTVLCAAVLLLVHARAHRQQHQPMRTWLVLAATLVVAGVGLSRVLLGVHYPTDVAGGVLLGIATALALTPILTPSREAG